MTEAVILAGGRSRRMGAEKALLDAGGGETLLSRLFGLLAARFARVLVSVPHEGASAGLRDAVARAVEGGRRAELVRDLRPGSQGPLAALEAALPRLEGERAFFVAVDAPVVDLGLVELLEEVAEAPGALGAVPVWRGRVEGAFAVYGRALAPAVRELLEEGERRLAALARVEGVRPVELGPGGGADPRAGRLIESLDELFRPLNTPRDLEAWRRGRRSR